MDIRKANENDLIEVLYLTKKFKELVSNANNINWSADNSTEIQLEEIINAEKLYVISEDTVLGTIQLESSINAHNKIIIQIKNFSIHPIGEKKGLAPFMLEFAIKEATDLKATTLCIEVKTTHNTCIAELEHYGFSINNSKTSTSDVLLFCKAITI